MMNHKLKTLAVALTLAACAGQANATLDSIDGGLTGNSGYTGSNTNNIGGYGSELFLSVYDPALNKSYIRDLGINMNNFLFNGSTAATAGTVAFAPNTPVNIGSGNVTSSGYNLTFGQDPLLSSWMGSTLSSNAIWMVGAGDSSGFQPRYITTVGSGNPTLVANPSLNLFSNVDGYLYGNNQLTTNGSNMGVNLNGSAAATPADGVAVYFTSGISSDWATSETSFLSTGKVGQSLGFYDLTGNAGVNVTATKYAGATWTLASNGTLGYSVSQVPVPAAIWLFGSGLLGLVGISRRKKV